MSTATAESDSDSNSGSDDEDDDESLPPSYDGHELPSTMPANYVCHYVCRRLNPRDMSHFSQIFNILVLGKSANAVDVYHDDGENKEE